MLETVQHFVIAGDCTTFCHCWRLAGDNIEMLESSAECERLHNSQIVLCFGHNYISVILVWMKCTLYSTHQLIVGATPIPIREGL